MSKFQTLTKRKLKCKGCRGLTDIRPNISTDDLIELAKAFNFEHSICTKQMAVKEQNRKRYRLHKLCRDAGLTVNAKERDVQGWEQNNLPPPAQKLLEIGYNFQHTLK